MYHTQVNNYIENSSVTLLLLEQSVTTQQSWTIITGCCRTLPVGTCMIVYFTTKRLMIIEQ